MDYYLYLCDQKLLQFFEKLVNANCLNTNMNHLTLELYLIVHKGVPAPMCIMASGNILASGNLCSIVVKLQLKLINKNVCYLHSASVNQIN